MSAPRVSVVVPTFDVPPDAWARLMSSLDRQTIGVTGFEVLVVDDGSSPQTIAMLMDSAQRPNVTLSLLPHFGWPSRPRNAGIDQATGDYVLFCDHDDWLGDRALEHLVRVADRDNADIVIPKMVGHSRSVPVELFAKDVTGASLDDGLLMTSLTPHKLFRRSFLLQQQLRFPEDVRRLEDQLFVTAAYLATDRISILASYPCYHHTSREDGANAGIQLPEAADYFAALRRLIELIDDRAPAKLRDQLLTRPYTQAVTRRLDGLVFLRNSRPARREWFAESRAVLLEMPDSVRRLLPVRDRVIADLARDNRYRDVVRLARWSQTLELRCLVDAVVELPDGLIIRGSGQLRAGDKPAVIHTATGPQLAARLSANSATGFDAAAKVWTLRLAARRPGGGNAKLVPASMTTDDPTSGSFAWETRIATTPNGHGQRLAGGTWRLTPQLNFLGWRLPGQVDLKPEAETANVSMNLDNLVVRIAKPAAVQSSGISQRSAAS